MPAVRRSGPAHGPAVTTATAARYVSPAVVVTSTVEPPGWIASTAVSSRTVAPASAARRACARTVRSAMQTPPDSCTSTGVPGAITNPGHRSIVASAPSHSKGEPAASSASADRRDPSPISMPPVVWSRRSPARSSSSRHASSAGPAMRT